MMSRKTKRAGAGIFVQPLQDETYEVVVGWEVVDTAPTYQEAMAKLRERMPERRTVDVTGHPRET